VGIAFCGEKGRDFGAKHTNARPMPASTTPATSTRSPARSPTWSSPRRPAFTLPVMVDGDQLVVRTERGPFRLSVTRVDQYRHAAIRHLLPSRGSTGDRQAIVLTR
jgi:hypothetical protein